MFRLPVRAPKSNVSLKLPDTTDLAPLLNTVPLAVPAKLPIPEVGTVTVGTPPNRNRLDPNMRPLGSSCCTEGPFTVRLAENRLPSGATVAVPVATVPKFSETPLNVPEPLYVTATFSATGALVVPAVSGDRVAPPVEALAILAAVIPLLLTRWLAPEGFAATIWEGLANAEPFC